MPSPSFRSLAVAIACLVCGCDAEQTASVQSENTEQDLVAFSGANVWDGTGADIIEDAVILVRDGRIEEIGSGVPPAASRTVDLQAPQVTVPIHR
jgi:imidazolonepropionase-like amidohydrolase